MKSERKICPWGCSGAQGEVDVVGAERARVPGVPATAALMRCGQCQRISLASIVTVRSKLDVPQRRECRIALGRFEGVAWVPAAQHLPQLLLRGKARRPS